LVTVWGAVATTASFQTVGEYARTATRSTWSQAPESSGTTLLVNCDRSQMAKPST
jgi:hypothetical protein